MLEALPGVSETSRNITQITDLVSRRYSCSIGTQADLAPRSPNSYLCLSGFSDLQVTSIRRMVTFAGQYQVFYAAIIISTTLRRPNGSLYGSAGAFLQGLLSGGAEGQRSGHLAAETNLYNPAPLLDAYWKLQASESCRGEAGKVGSWVAASGG